MIRWARWPGSPTWPSSAAGRSTAGMVVITGSVIPTVDIAPGERLDFVLDGVGEASLSAT